MSLGVTFISDDVVQLKIGCKMCISAGTSIQVFLVGETYFQIEQKSRRGSTWKRFKIDSCSGGVETGDNHEVSKIH